jgi:hypothetical protein
MKKALFLIVFVVAFLFSLSYVPVETTVNSNSCLKSERLQLSVMPGGDIVPKCVEVKEFNFVETVDAKCRYYFYNGRWYRVGCWR